MSCEKKLKYWDFPVIRTCTLALDVLQILALHILEAFILYTVSYLCSQDHKVKVDCVRGPQHHPRVYDLLGGLAGLGRQSHSQVRFLTVKRPKSKIRKGRGSWGEVQREPTQASKSPLIVESHRTHLNSHSSELWQTVWNLAYQGSSVETQCPEFSVGASHEGPSAQHAPKFQTYRRKAGIRCKAHYLWNILSTGSHSYRSRIGGNSTEIWVPRWQQRANDAGGLSWEKLSQALCINPFLYIGQSPEKI